MDQAQQQADHGGFAAAGGADQRHDLAGSGDQGGVAQHRLSGIVGKVGAVHLYGEALYGSACQRVVHRLSRFRTQIEQVADAVSGNRGVEEIGHRPHQRVEGGGQLRALRQEQRHGAVQDLPRPQQVQAVAEGGHLHGGAEDGQQRFRLDAEKVVVQTGLPEILLPLAQTVAVPAGDAEALDGVQIVERLRFVGHQVAADLPQVLLMAAHAADKTAGGQQQEGGAGQCQQGHDPVVVQDHRQSGNKGIGRHDQIRQPVDGVAGHGAGVVGQAVQQIAAGKAVQRLPVGVQQPVKDLRLNVVIDPQGNAGGDAGGDAAQQQPDQGRQQHHKDHEPQL